MLFSFVFAAALTPVVTSESVPHNPDDPAIWINRSRPAESLILVTDKAPEGAVYVLGLDGKIREKSAALARPNNVDVEGDIAVVTERLKNQLRVFRVSATKPHLTDLGAVPVFEAPMGIGLYRSRGGRLHAVVSRKSGPDGAYLHQYEISIADGKASGRKVREFGRFSGGADNEIEAIVVDDKRGLIYYADESCCLRLYHADPRKGDAEIAAFGRDEWKRQREGLAMYGADLIATDQISGASEFRVYGPSRKLKAVWTSTADSTDGIDATDVPLGPKFPHGLLVVMNSGPKNFLFYALP
ncbi:MAG: phytase [Acidobacteria bacterium]|nr:phytase [Acidobacteriota bacterium]